VLAEYVNDAEKLGQYIAFEGDVDGKRDDACDGIKDGNLEGLVVSCNEGTLDAMEDGLCVSRVFPE
jgi:hypothetical protein